MSQVITFAPNVPQVLSLQDPTGDWDGTAYEVSYPTSDGRVLQLPYAAAVKLNKLDVQPGQTFQVCRRISGKPGEPAYWDITLTAQTEQEKAAQEAEPAPPLREVPKRKQPSMAPPIQPRLFDRGTGTDGPAPAPLPQIAAYRRIAPPVQIPYNVAFREIVQFVTQALKDQGLSWNDQAVQDACCTVLIDAGKRNLLVLWERP